MKKLIITLIVLAVIVVGTIIGVKIYKDHRKNSNPVKCTNVALLNTGYWEYGETMDGSISETGDQKVYIEMNRIISEVNVEPGQQVSVGDKLLTYDMTGQQLQIDSMKTQLEVYKTDLLIAERQLEKLRNMTPLEDLTTEETTTETTEATSEVTTEKTTEYGTPGDAERIFKEHPDWVMYPDGSFGPPPGEDPGNTDDIIDPDEPFDPVDPFDPDDPDDPVEPIYDRETLNEMIKEKEDSIKKMKNDIEIYEIQIKKEEKKLEEGYVYAETNGIVRSVDISEENISSGQPVIVVSSNSGYKTEVYVNEWKLSQINIGDPVTIYSYETGSSYTGKVSSVENTPTEDYGYYGGATASTYPMTIVIDEPCDDLMPGYWVQVTMGEGGGGYDPYGGDNDKLYIPLPYVREENGKSYVMINNDGRLKKKYVKTGKVVYSYAVEIKSGLSMNDYIAFPYGKDVIEGKKCINVEGYADQEGY